MLKFRLAICLAASVIACCTSTSAQPLRQLTDQRGIRLGAAADPAHLTEALYAETLAREFSQLEPENAMKFGPIHPGPATYNFGPPDGLVSFARTQHVGSWTHTRLA